MRRHGPAPVSLWRVLDALAKARQPDSRAHLRYWRLRYWRAVRVLLGAGLLRRHGRLIATLEFPIRPKLRARPRDPHCRPDGTLEMSPSITTATSEMGGSSPEAVKAETTRSGPQASQAEVVIDNRGALARALETERAKPTRAEIIAAARHLARQPRRRKIWSGWLHGKRMTRLRPVVVPGGEVLPAYFVRRRFVYVLLPDTPEYQGRIFERHPARDVQVYRSPEARLLGSLKSGVRERPSERKQASARINGTLPPRPGSRPRGRPCKHFICLH